MMIILQLKYLVTAYCLAGLLNNACKNDQHLIFFSRILDDCCRAAVFYAQRMTANVEEARRARKQRRRKREAEDDFDTSPKIFIGMMGR